MGKVQLLTLFYFIINPTNLHIVFVVVVGDVDFAIELYLFFFIYYFTLHACPRVLRVHARIENAFANGALLIPTLLSLFLLLLCTKQFF